MVPERLFLHEGHNKAKETFESKRRLLNVHEDSLFALAWDVDGYAKLLEESEAIQNSISEILERLDGHPGDRGNIPAVVAVLKKEMELYVKGLTTKKREAASHLFLFMISDELRNFKPYAVPVHVLKYKSITDAKMRELKEELRKAIIECGMTTVGMYHFYITRYVYTS